jgi:hypothetical protein
LEAKVQAMYHVISSGKRSANTRSVRQQHF